MTLIEMCIVLLILTILMAIAVPAFLSARANAQAKTCIANLWEIESAKQRWAMENRKAATDTPTQEELVGGYIKRWPECPTSGTYTIQAVDTSPSCSIGGEHAIR